MKGPDRPRRGVVEVLFAQWPGVLGLGLIAVGVVGIWQTRAAGGRAMNRGLIALIGVGVALVGYWALANKDDGYNF